MQIVSRCGIRLWSLSCDLVPLSGTLPCLVTRVRPTSLDVSALERIQTYVRFYAAERREVEKIGPFLATFGRHSNGPYLNYAVPDDWSEPTHGEVVALVRAYEKRRLRPRVELVPALASDAAASLADAGFFSEGEFSLMACTRESLREVDRPSAIEVVLVENDEQCRAMLEIRHDAFDEPGPVTEADVARARSTVRSGGVAAVVVDTVSGEAVASGACLVPYDRITELTSIGVRSGSRRRGIGAVVTATLARAALLGGAEIVYLTPAHDEGERLYERVGFVTVGESLHLGH
jgi:ribosomal protein S18 acetylase RimI-like enzyme